MRAHPHASWNLIAALLTAAVAYSLHLTAILGPVWSYVAAINLVTLLLYRLDKWASPHKHAPRIPNATLVLLAAAGGAAGALIGVATGHKTSDRYRWLRTLIWFFAAIQLILLSYVLLFPTGS